MANQFPTTPERAKMMASIKSRNTKPETLLRLACLSLGWEFIPNDKSLPGSPDLAFHNAKLAVFINGCFWHGCPRHYRSPKTNIEAWQEKLIRNKRRDLRVRRKLNRMGWSVMVVWEHDLVPNHFPHAIALLASRLNPNPQAWSP